MTTTDKIQTAIQMMNEHDWWWAWAEYCAVPKSEAYSHMRAYVELVITSKKAWTDDNDKKADYQSMIDKLMVTLQPSTMPIAA